MVENEGVKCLIIKGDLKKDTFCKSAIKKTFDTFGFINVLVNNAAMQFLTDSLEEITTAQLKKTFETNI